MKTLSTLRLINDLNYGIDELIAIRFLIELLKKRFEWCVRRVISVEFHCDFLPQFLRNKPGGSDRNEQQLSFLSDLELASHPISGDSFARLQLVAEHEHRNPSMTDHLLTVVFPLF